MNFLPFMVLPLYANLEKQDGALLEVAEDLGCLPTKAFWLLAFTLSLDDLVISSFATGPGATTLPMKIYSQVRLGVTPEINAVCSVLVTVVTIGVITATVITKRRREEQLTAAQ